MYSSKDYISFCARIETFYFSITPLLKPKTSTFIKNETNYSCSVSSMVALRVKRNTRSTGEISWLTVEPKLSKPDKI